MKTRSLIICAIFAVGWYLEWISVPLAKLGLQTLGDILGTNSYFFRATAIVGVSCLKASVRTLGIVGAIGCFLIIFARAWIFLVPYAYPVVIIEFVGYGAVLAAALMLMAPSPKPRPPRTDTPAASASLR